MKNEFCLCNSRFNMENQHSKHSKMSRVSPYNNVLKKLKIENSPENSAKYSYKNDFSTFLFKNVMFLLIWMKSPCVTTLKK